MVVYYYIVTPFTHLNLKHNIFIQIFVSIVANTGMISIGIGVAMSGLVIAQLKDPNKELNNSNDVKLTLDEESWFGK